MAKRNKKHEKRIKKLIVVCMLSAIILTVSTYAWFIGMRSVSVNAFEVKIAGAEGLALSLDGSEFGDSVTINENNYATTYTGNTNSWTDLKPISTIGKMDAGTNGSVSRMVIYEKSSLTASGGGYRLLSEKLDNTGTKEADGYIAFDLFIKNMSGEAYYNDRNTANEEAIYLTYDSAVTVGTSGTEKTGIENSVRVAFTQVGRVKSDAGATAAQQIKCLDTYVEAENGDYNLSEGVYTKVAAGTGNYKKVVTNICRDATIWEPNDVAHVDNAISWYKNSCKTRTIVDGKDVYSGDCTDIADGNFYKTYAVAKTITENKEDDNRDYEIDVYDGSYNSYKQSTSDVVGEGTVGDGYLDAVDTITDSEKLLSGVYRPEFMTLAPNSITKVRIYIYLEGQDIDNYDFASLGKQIKVNFGFTKEKFTAEDIDYIDDENVEGDELTTDLYRYFYIPYEATGAVSGLPTSGADLGLEDGIENPIIAEYNNSTKILKISKSITKSFEFKDGETTKIAERSVDGEGKVTWTIKNKE